MLYYRLYFMCPHTGHIMRFAEYEAQHDEAAIALAREHEGAHALELWSERRKVARIEPSDPAIQTVANWQLTRRGRTQSAEPGN
jgi:hypothetical protein